MNNSVSGRSAIGRRTARRWHPRLVRAGALAVAATLLAAGPATALGVQAQVDSTNAPTTVTPTTLAATTTAGPVIPTTVAPTVTTLPATTSPSAAATTVPGAIDFSTTTVPAVPATLPVPTTTLAPARVLKQGMKGDDVEAMERKLDILRYDVGVVDKKFDWQTWQGLMAFQKLNGLPRTAKFDAKTQAALAAATVPGGVIPNGGLPRIEVDISRQVMLYFDDYGLNRVVAVSTGSGRDYCDFSKKSQKTVCGSAVTPRGNYKIQRRIKGDRESDLGHLFNPMYFNGGYAIHGSPSIPAGPASHGCVRVSNYTATWMFDTVTNGTPVYVFD